MPCQCSYDTPGSRRYHPITVNSFREGKPTHIYSPFPTINRLRQFTQLSFSIKVDEDDEVPDRYCAPCAITCGDGLPCFEPYEEKTCHWHAVVPDLHLPLTCGKKGKQQFSIHTVKLYHTCTAIGYILSQRHSKLRPDLQHSDPNATAAAVKSARQAGEDINIAIDIPIVAYICDTDIRALTIGPHANHILDCPVVIVECTYLEEEMKSEADRRGHITWSDLAQVIATSAAATTFILIHFSLRYSDTSIVEFFMQRSGLPLRRLNEDESHIPRVILWLDSGICKFTIKNPDGPHSA